MKRSYLAGAMLLAITACAAEEAGPTAAPLEARDLAARSACVAERLARRAEEELRTLQELQMAPGPLGFQRAYLQHAELRLRTLSLADSALNHARSSADSAALDSASRAVRLRVPDPGSVEENVIRSYENNFLAMITDEDHPCNWQSQLNRD